MVMYEKMPETVAVIPSQKYIHPGTRAPEIERFTKLMSNIPKADHSSTLAKIKTK